MFERLTATGCKFLIPAIASKNELLDEIRRHQKYYDRLAAYEDSGLSPEEVQELAKAKAEGRLVVLPCKVGDIGWQITECFDGDRGCQGNCDECPKKKTVVSFRFISKAHIVRHVEKGDFGKTVFLTREAAEKALGGGEE